MVDQNSQFYAILTNVGAAKQANADALGIAWKITQMGVGDANGADPTPNATQTSLINEWRRAPLNQLKVDDKDASIIVAEQVIPADIGGKWIREIGLYDEAGDLVAVANCAPTYKPVLSQGSGRTQVLRMSLVVSNAANVQLKIDPSVVLATREWVTEELARQDFKYSVLAATTANITLSGLQTIDGVALMAGVRVLVKNQTAAKDNGLYTVVSGAAWIRCDDANSSAKVTPGLLVLVERGTANSDSAWQLVTDAPITLGVTALAFEMAFGRTGVTAGTYRSVQVDKYGRVVAASNPTTVAGYGITDVYTKSETYTRIEITTAISTAVSTAVAGLVDSSPGALDTLKELAAAIGNDPNYAATMVAELAKKAPLASPALTGTPTAPTAGVGVNTSQIATMAALLQGLAAYGIGSLISPDATDFNAVTQGGLFRLARNSANSPFADADMVLLNIPSNSQAGFQLAASCSDNIGNGRLFWRSKAANSFSPWQRAAWADSPAFTGNPTAPTQAVGDNDTSIATTAFVQAALAAFGVGSLNAPLVTDLNSATAGGFWRAAGGAANSVGTGVVAGFTVPYSSTGCLQILSQLTAAGSPLHWRAQVAGAWVDWSPFAGLASPVFTGDPKAPTPSTGDNDTSVATTAFVHNTLASFGLGNGTAAGVGAGTTAEQLAALPAGNYYLQSAVSPYPDFAFAMRLKYQTTRGFEMANIPYTDRFFGRACNSDGTWRAPVELAKLSSPTFTGDVGVPTRATADRSANAASTQYVANLLASLGWGTSDLSDLPNGTDLNTMNVGGSYQVNSVVNGPAGYNGGVLFVAGTNAQYYTHQLFFPQLVNKMFHRCSYGATNGVANWRDWEETTDLTTVTALIKASRRCFSGNVVGVGINTTLTAAQTGFAFNATSAVTITLPAAVDAGSGGTFSIRNVSSGNVTIALPTGKIYEKNTAADTAVLKPGEWVEIQASTTSYFVNSRGKLGEVAETTTPTFAGEVTVKGANVQRYIHTLEKYGVVQRVDDNAYYILLTDSGSPYGSFNALRPLKIDLATGAVTMTHGTFVQSPPDNDDSTQAASSAWVNKRIAAAAASRDVGKVFFHAAGTPPAGALKANGAAVSRTTYAALFAAIGTTHGAGDGSTTFNLPDMRGEFVRGLDDGRGVDSGRLIGSRQGQMLENHVHAAIGSRLNGAVATSAGQLGANSVLSFGDPASDVQLATSNPTSGTRGAETRPRNVALLGCINYM